MKEMRFEIVGLEESNNSMGDIIDQFHGVNVNYNEERCYIQCRNAFREYMNVKKLVPERSAKKVQTQYKKMEKELKDAKDDAKNTHITLNLRDKQLKLLENSTLENEDLLRK